MSWLGKLFGSEAQKGETMTLASSAMKETRELRKMVKDPVCGMEVDEKSAPAKSLYMGKAYYFCSLDCKRIFDAAKYAGSGGHEMAGHGGHMM